MDSRRCSIISACLCLSPPPPTARLSRPPSQHPGHPRHRIHSSTPPACTRVVIPVNNHLVICVYLCVYLSICLLCSALSGHLLYSPFLIDLGLSRSSPLPVLSIHPHIPIVIPPPLIPLTLLAVPRPIPVSQCSVQCSLSASAPLSTHLCTVPSHQPYFASISLLDLSSTTTTSTVSPPPPSLWTHGDLKPATC